MYALENWRTFMMSKLPEGTRIDWHYVGGRAVFKALGDVKAARNVMQESLDFFETNSVGDGGYELSVSMYSDADLQEAEKLKEILLRGDS